MDAYSSDYSSYSSHSDIISNTSDESINQSDVQVNDINTNINTNTNITIEDISYNSTPSIFSEAIEQNSKEIVLYHLTTGFPSDGVDTFESPLIYAIKYNRPEIVKLLLLFKANVCKKDIKGEYDALQWLCCRKCDDWKELFDLFINAGADVDVKTTTDDTLVHLASRNGQLEILRYLITHRKMSVNATNMVDMTPLHIAADTGCLEIVEFLIQSGANLHISTDLGWTALDYSIQASQNSIRVAQYLVSAGADVNRRLKHGWTLLMCAAYTGKVELVKLLLENGADTMSERGGLIALDYARMNYTDPRYRQEIINMIEDWMQNNSNNPNIYDTLPATPLYSYHFPVNSDCSPFSTPGSSTLSGII